jgi:hypothetical protein
MTDKRMNAQIQNVDDALDTGPEELGRHGEHVCTTTGSTTICLASVTSHATYGFVTGNLLRSQIE